MGLGIDEKPEEIEIERKVKKTEPVSDLSQRRTGRSMLCFSLYGVWVLDWVCCTGRICLVRGKRNSHAGTNHKQTVWCQWVGSTILAKSRLKF